MNGFNQQIRFCISPDNVKIAYAQTGAGLPLFKTGNWLTNIEADAENFIWQHLIGELSKKYACIRYDQRGCGMSAKNVLDFSLEAQISDISAVVTGAKIERFSLLGISNGTAPAIAYAAQNPEKVDRLILFGGAVNEKRNISEAERIQKFLHSVKSFWEKDSSSNEFAAKLFPEISPAHISKLAKIRRDSCSGETAFQILKIFFETDITEFAKQVKCPTLIIHSMDDEFLPFSQSGLLSSLVPDSKLILLDSRNHLLLENEPAWQEFVTEVHSFLNDHDGQISNVFDEPFIDLQATIPMEDARWEQVGELFAEAMKLPTDERRVLLNQIDSNAVDLRREVEALIENAERPKHLRSTGLFSKPIVERQSENEIFEDQIISHYKILKKLGEGGMGVVFRAMDMSLEREVALKFLPRRYNTNPAMKLRFSREARAAAALDHPNVCGVFEVGESEDGRLFIAMPFYKGKTLKEKILEKSVTINDAVEYAFQIAEGLFHAHQAGIVHRDIKPENILITFEGQLKILDFGVAKIADADVTQKGILLGTISYMSPEQAAGETVDARSDLWSLGLVIYEMLTGQQPFKNEEISTMISTILLREPVPVSHIAENIPSELEKIISKAIKKNKNERYQNAREFADDLANLKGIITSDFSVNKPDFNYEKFVPLASAEVPNNLVSQLTPLVGRGREITDVTGLFRREDIRLVTLSGIGGTGKTRLSHKIARQMLAEFPDGVFFVELSAITKVDLVAPEIAQILSIKESGSEQIENILKNFLAAKKILLILDNFEQIVKAAPLVAEILASAPGLKILVTSRNILQIRGEHEYKVPPLDLPDPHKPHSENSLAQYASVSLFVQRAKAVKNDFSLTNENVATIVEICEKLEGLPLAIELAAVRIKILSPKELLTRLSNQLKFLIGGAKDSPVRQQTMRNAISWSYDLLDENERKLFRRWSVFVGGCTLEAAEAICNCADDFDVFEGVLSLTDKSLLRREEQTDGSMRFRMLGVVREFSTEKLSESESFEIVKSNHSNYFLQFAEQLESRLRGAEQAKWLDILEKEHGNLRSAFEYFLQHDIEKCLTLAGTMHRLWSVHGHYSEGRKRLRTALEKGQAASKPARTKALIPAADLAWSQGDLDAAQLYYEECLNLSREISDQRKIAQSCNGLAITRLNQNDFDIRPLLEESLQIGREIGDKPIVGVALMGLGELSRLERKNAEARLFYEEIVTEARKGGDTFNLLYALFNLGSVSCMEGDSETSHAQFAESLLLGKDLGSMRAVADCLDGFGCVSAINSKAEKAAKLYGAAEALRESVGFEIQTADRIFRDHFIKITKNLIGENAFLEFKTAGRNISMDDAVNLALEKS
ncbi:MAG: alpha/beta fold hydrolase [Pyrinomonadaceae bacterium]